MTDLPRSRTTDLRVMGEAECLVKAASEPVGRFAFLDADGIAVLPVNHVVSGDAIRFRTSGGDKLAAAVERQRVTFEVDRYDPVSRTGWSINARGTAQLEWDKDALVEVYASPLSPYADADRRHVVVRIQIDQITGRAID